MKPVATEWFQHERLAPDLIRITEKHFDPIARANLWLLTGRDRHLLIDTGLGVSDLARYLAPLLDKPLTVVCTHMHFDHAGGLADFHDTCLHCQEIELMKQGDATAALARPEQGFNVDEYFDEHIDNAHGCLPDHYAASMVRLARLAPRLVHPGHYHSFGTERLHRLVTDYLAGRRAPGCPASA